jgi:hypothetical protein
MHVEHINPRGSDGLENLCLSCASCNLSKATVTSASDPDTGDTVSLFNPRTQIWSMHFEWIENGTLLCGLTTIGRATILRLHMNQKRIVIARKMWVKAGEHPPKG